MLDVLSDLGRASIDISNFPETVPSQYIYRDA